MNTEDFELEIIGSDLGFKSDGYVIFDVANSLSRVESKLVTFTVDG